MTVSRGGTTNLVRQGGSARRLATEVAAGRREARLRGLAGAHPARS
ncbi:hypothetical protein [Roseiflexus sp. RS-1]|nr:hypothetical protein [Roseiflexus sp. RS-1]